MNVNMWIKALQVIPRLDKDEWDRLDIISRWLVSTRSAVLIMTFISAAIAGLLAIRDGGFVWWRWLLLAIGLVFAHATNNLLNDLTDYRRGVDTDNYYRTQYGPQPVQQGLLSERGLLRYAAVTGIIALAAGIPLVVQGGWLALGLLLAGVFFVFFYTWPLKYIGMGEVAVILVWGPLMIGGGYYVITGVWDWNVALFSLVYALGPTMVIFGKHIDKLEADRAKKIHTLPVLIGEKAARITAIVMMVLQYLLVIYLIVTGFVSPWMLVVFISLFTIPRVIRMFSKPKPAERPADYGETVWPLWFSAGAFYHTRIFGSLFVAGMILELIFKAIFA
ncbi:MAG: prenyltransferase [Anaerolineae bacterium]|jgi:1,4-dihydroxy-2-naphthoate octaprenyltransferase|nr:prenyltransferase [Anaerolineae bacterium]